jgi:hypothetical protein
LSSAVVNTSERPGGGVGAGAAQNGELADLAETVAAEVERLLRNAKRALRKAQADADGRKAEGRRDPAAGPSAWPAGPGGQWT